MTWSFEVHFFPGFPVEMPRTRRLVARQRTRSTLFSMSDINCQLMPDEEEESGGGWSRWKGGKTTIS